MDTGSVLLLYAFLYRRFTETGISQASLRFRFQVRSLCSGFGGSLCSAERRCINMVDTLCQANSNASFFKTAGRANCL